MQTFSPEARCPVSSAVALGIFDGVHLGHREVLRAVPAQTGLLPCVFTFSADSVQRKHARGIFYIYSDLQKRALLSACGIAGVFCADFADYSFHSGAAFAAYVLRDILNAAVVVCGADFRFGREASCNTDDLRRLGRQYGFRVVVVPPVISDGAPVSSSRIRSLLTAGELPAANALLGTPYRITGVVHHGNELGRTLGFPTMNQRFGAGQCVPAHGVYAARALRGGKWLPAVTNIGLRPTIGDLTVPLSETHIIHHNELLYGETVTVTLHRYLREETRFTSTDALRRQLQEDCAAAQAYFQTAGGISI